MNNQLTLDSLAEICGYFVTNCEQKCNNKYGCSHPDNTEGIFPESCTIHAQCQSTACSLAMPIMEGSWEMDESGDTIMELYEGEVELDKYYNWKFKGKK